MKVVPITTATTAAIATAVAVLTKHSEFNLSTPRKSLYRCRDDKCDR